MKTITSHVVIPSERLMLDGEVEGPCVSAFRRWLKFNLVGGIGIIVQLAALAVLTHGAHLDYLIATALAVECAVLHNFAWHERFTWSDRASIGLRQVLARLLRFNCTTGAVSIGGNLLFMRLLAGQAHLPPLVANLISIAACSIINFLVNDRVVFRAAHTRADPLTTRRSQLATIQGGDCQ